MKELISLLIYTAQIFVVLREDPELSTMLHRLGFAMLGMLRSHHSDESKHYSQSLWPLLFVNQDSILCLGPKREPDSVDFILLMIWIFNAGFEGLPLIVVCKRNSFK